MLKIVWDSNSNIVWVTLRNFHVKNKIYKKAKRILYLTNKIIIDI